MKKAKGIGTDTASDKNDEMIFKIQLSLVSSDNRKHIRIYNKDRTLQWQQEYKEDLMKTFGTTLKSFWYGYIDAQKRIVITSKAPDQSW